MKSLGEAVAGPWGGHPLPGRQVNYDTGGHEEVIAVAVESFVELVRDLGLGMSSSLPGIS